LIACPGTTNGSTLVNLPVDLELALTLRSKMYSCPQCNQIAFLPECEHCGPTDERGEIAADESVFISKKKVRTRPLPNPFRIRLSSFLGLNESEVMQVHPRTSQMQFRLFTSIAYIGGKKIELIRQLLNCIIKPLQK